MLIGLTGNNIVKGLKAICFLILFFGCPCVLVERYKNRVWRILLLAHIKHVICRSTRKSSIPKYVHIICTMFYK